MSGTKVTSLVPVPVKSTELSTEKYIDDGCIDNSDIAIPTLKLLQGVSDEIKNGVPGAKPGIFWNPYTNEPIEGNVETLVVFLAKNRWKRDNPVAGTKKCVSFDNVQGSEYGACGPCKYRQWSRGGPGGDRPPECSLIYVFYAMTQDGPVAIRLRKKAEKYAKQFLTAKVSSDRNWWTFPTVLTVIKEQGRDSSGNPTSYWAIKPSWDRSKSTAPELIEMAKTLATKLREADESGRLRSAEDEAEGEDDTERVDYK